MTNAISSGGASATTVIPTIHKFGEVLNYVAAIAESSHTFTPTAPIDPDDYECIIIDIDAEGAGAGNLRLQINGQVGANYESDGASIAGGVETLINEAAQTSGRVFQSIVDTLPFVVRIIIFLPKGTGHTEPNATWVIQGYSGAGGRKEQLGGSLNVSIGTISSVTLFMSASNWEQDTKMTFTPISRARYQTVAP